MKRGLLILGLASVAGAAQAVLSVGPTLLASEDFDGLPLSTQTGYFSATAGVQNIALGTTFDGVKLAGTGTSGMNLIADNGSGNTGGIVSYGVSGIPERALGMLASGANIPGVGVQIVNNSGIAWQSITITFVQENWRSSTSVQNVMAASWSTTASASNYLSAASGFTNVTALDLVGPAPVASNGALDGNNPANQALRSATLTFSSALNVGDSVFVRWQDVNDAGNDAGLALDTFSVQATAVPEPATMAALGLGVAALLRRRSRK